ncbi:lipopolysaccharide biosynthesis protein [Alteraurantiacibacter aquimixticola]|nr:lipopolysaccharide biosynthesis protein [Alteraurantiacibacter aquimixticola]
MTQIRSRLARGSMLLMASRVIINVLAFASTIMLARLLTPEDFGLVAIATTILAIAMAVTQLSLAESIIQLDDPTPDHLNTAWTMGVIRAAIIASLFAIAAYPTAQFFEDTRLANIMFALGAGMMINGFANPRRALFQRDLVFKQEFLIEVSAKLAMVATSISIAWIFRSYWALIGGLLASYVMTVGIGYVLMPYRPHFTLSRFRELWSFSFWLTLSQAMNTINWRFDQLLIGKFIGRASLGAYTVGDNLAQMPTREMTTPLTKTLFPGFASLGKDKGRVGAGYARAQAIVTTLVLPVGVGVALIADPAVRLGMGEKWAASIFVIQALASVFALQTIGSLAHPLALSQGRTKLIFKRDCQYFALRLPAIVGGLYFGGLTGVVIGRVFVGLMGIGFNVAIVRRLVDIPIRRQLQANLRPVLSAIIMVAAVLLARGMWTHGTETSDLVLDLALSIPLGATAYMGSLIILWAISGYPDGPEREAMSVLAAYRDKFFARKELN